MSDINDFPVLFMHGLFTPDYPMCRTRWRDAVERDARLAGIDQDLESMASDRPQQQDMFALLVS